MNTYTYNLRLAVITSLQKVDLDQKNLFSQLNASKITLQYAGEATLAANKNHKASTSEMDFKELIKKQAILNNDLSKNLVVSAAQADQYVKQSITQTALCAANVQVAANAIVRLASDMGSILSIVTAADADTDIFAEASNARKLINDTAEAAETTSQLAMNASILTSEVSSVTVFDKAKSTNTLMANIFQVISNDFDAAAQAVVADEASLAVATEKEKLAEESFKMVSAGYKAVQMAYQLTNKELNLGLSVSAITADSFTVSFNLIKNVFDPKGPSSVVSYYIILVKESNELTFTISEAEKLMLQAACKSIINVQVAPGIKDPVSKQVDFNKMPGTDKYPAYVLQDADGEEIKAGHIYVVFLLAVYTDAYKKVLNNYENFLSAPSLPFLIN